MIRSNQLHHIEQALTIKLGAPCTIKNFQSIGGGCINESFFMQTTEGNFFIKWNDKSRYPGMFATEAGGLTLLKSTGAIHIPQVIIQDDFENTSFIILEW